MGTMGAISAPGARSADTSKRWWDEMPTKPRITKMQSRNVKELHREILQKQVMHVLSATKGDIRNFKDISKSLNNYRTKSGFPAPGKRTVYNTLNALVASGKLERGKKPLRIGNWEYWYRLVPVKRNAGRKPMDRVVR